MDISEIFTDIEMVRRIQSRLPELYYIAELESSRAGRVGMEVGSARERIIIAMLIYKFGQENVDSEIPITESEIDVQVFGKPLSIKTITGRYLSGVKLIWTVDAEQALKFSREYTPCCDILLTQIYWDNPGYLFYFPHFVQYDVMDKIGRENYIKLPKAGTNPRGVEVSREALDLLSTHPECYSLRLEWTRKKIAFDPYQRWLDLWKRE